MGIENRVGSVTTYGPRSDLSISRPQFRVAERTISSDVIKAVRQRDNNTCRGIDDKNGLPICIIQIVSIDGELVQASLRLGFNIDVSHYTHNKNSEVYYSEEGMRCQCLACHLLYTRGLGHFRSEKKINKRLVYVDEARDLRRRNEFNHLDVSIRYPKDVLDALTEKLFNYGVRWNYEEEVIVPEVWLGPGRRDQIVDIAKRLYAPSEDDARFWSWGR